MTPSQNAINPASPFCGGCGYDLSGVTESSKCPECGRPLVEVLRWPDRAGPHGIGRRYTSPLRVLGMPLVHIALGPGPEGRMGKARGFVAVGDDAMGVIAFGGFARGVVAVGGLGAGVFSFGGLSLGLVGAVGGGAGAGGFAAGGTSLAGAAAVGGAALAAVGSVSGRGAVSPAGFPMPDAVIVTAIITGAVFMLTLLLIGLVSLTARPASPEGAEP